MCHQPLTGCSPQAAIVCGQIKYSGQQQLARNSLFHHTATQHTQILECRKITEHIAPGKRAVCVYVWRPLLYLYPPSTVAAVSPAAKCSACSFPVSPLKWLTRRYQLASLSSNSFVWHVSTCRSGTSHSSVQLASAGTKSTNLMRERLEACGFWSGRGSLSSPTFICTRSAVGQNILCRRGRRGREEEG